MSQHSPSSIDDLGGWRHGADVGRSGTGSGCQGGRSRCHRDGQFASANHSRDEQVDRSLDALGKRVVVDDVRGDRTVQEESTNLTA